MLNIIRNLRLVRYLVVWRVTGDHLRLSTTSSSDISYTLGNIIAKRLPASEAQAWRHAAKYWSAYPELLPLHTHTDFALSDTSPSDPQLVPISPWPIESVIFPYPAKQVYDKGDPILLELKLFGQHAQHELFLDIILPALEAASQAKHHTSAQQDEIWGHVEIQAIYAARGMTWEPFMKGGHLDTTYRPTPDQWAEGIAFHPPVVSRYHTLLWLMPFEFKNRAIRDPYASTSPSKQQPLAPLPSLRDLLGALLVRVRHLLPEFTLKSSDVLARLTSQEQASLKEHLLKEYSPSKLRASLESIPKEWPECWLGVQRFPSIPVELLPSLQLASILHIGKHTHVGYGTFSMR
jgi:hypothetical protein